jgi:hypothetical protein
MAPVAGHLDDWSQVTAAFDSFPPPSLNFGPEGDSYRTAWIFRGHKSTTYELEPRIERENKGKDCDWAALESMLLLEFQSKARMYMNAYDLADLQDKPSWLALMQHYGIPTRLLDFSYSPYVALYLALRERTEKEQLCDAALWAVDATAVAGEAERLFWAAKRTVEEHEARTTGQPRKQRAANLNPAFAATDRDVYEGEHMSWNNRTQVAVAPRDLVRSYFNNAGFVDLALPPVQNRRLSSQQGVFLLNGAENRTFRDSLFTMMNAHKGEWCRLFHIPAATLLDLERRLFQMNIHDISLFPDMEGLAGFVRQKARLHFAPQVTSTSTK